MTRKHFIDLADRIRMFNKGEDETFTPKMIGELADFCKASNSNFNRELWLGYIDGTRGPNGKHLS